MSTWAYRGILLLYPPDLRRDFGPEMTELFSEDLDDAWRSCGFGGALRVWWCALCEILRVALLGQRTNPGFVVPSIAFALNTVVVGAELVLSMMHATTGPRGFPLVLDVAPIVVFNSVAVALTGIAVVHTGKTRVVSLGLDSEEITPCSKSAI